MCLTNLSVTTAALVKGCDSLSNGGDQHCHCVHSAGKTRMCQSSVPSKHGMTLEAASIVRHNLKYVIHSHTLSLSLSDLEYLPFPLYLP